MILIHSFWNSVEFVTRLNYTVQIIGACMGVLIVFVGYHLNSLQESKGRPREISEQQKAKFIAILKDAPKGAVLVKTNAMESQETGDYADAIRSLLDAAGYSGGHPVTEVGSRAPSNASDVWLMVNTQATAPDYAGNIQNALKAIGIDAHGYEAKGQVEWIKDGDCIVFISVRN